VITRVLAALFLMAGAGAGLAALRVGDGFSVAVLAALAVVLIAVGAGVLAESTPAWWAGAAITGATVVLDVVLRLHDGGWIAWSAALALFGISAVQGVRDRAHSTPHRT
jgi:hypothetical protein